MYKYFGILTMGLCLCATGLKAQTLIPVKMTFSGTNVATTINLQASTVTDEQHSAGTGTFGPFTFRELHADLTGPVEGSAGPSFGVLKGGGAFRFDDGSMLIVTITEGSTGCINLDAGTAALRVNYQIVRGTGRFAGAAGTLVYKATMRALFRNAANSPALLTLDGEIEGTVSMQR